MTNTVEHNCWTEDDVTCVFCQREMIKVTHRIIPRTIWHDYEDGPLPDGMDVYAKRSSVGGPCCVLIDRWFYA